VNLAWLSASAAQRTLLWDLDPQAAASWILRCLPGERTSAKKLLAGKRELQEVVLASSWRGLDVLPADFSYRNFDVHLSARKRPAERLLRLMRPLSENYDVIFLDCPPGISLLSESVLRAADMVVVPLLPTPLSVRMLAQLRDFVQAEGWGDLVLAPFFSMVDRRKSLHHGVIAQTRAQWPTLLATEIPYSSDIERMTLRRAPLPAFSPRSAAGLTYVALWSELMPLAGLSAAGLPHAGPPLAGPPALTASSETPPAPVSAAQ
jgi:chromosome partitioning protein